VSDGFFDKLRMSGGKELRSFDKLRMSGTKGGKIKPARVL
jgi:hypothetical protein